MGQKAPVWNRYLIVSLAVKVPLSATDGQNVVWLLSNVELWYSSMFMPSWEWGSHDDVAGSKILYLWQKYFTYG
jgi:hypothetical protein